MTEPAPHRRPISVVLGEFMATVSDHTLDHGKPDNFDLWARTLVEHMRREGYTVRDESPAEAEIARLMRQLAANSAMMDRSREYWLKAANMALAGDTSELERACDHAEIHFSIMHGTGKQRAADQIIRNLRLKKMNVGWLQTIIHCEWRKNPKSPDWAAIRYIIDELVERDGEGEILF